MNPDTIIAIDPGSAGAAVVRPTVGGISDVEKFVGHSTHLKIFSGWSDALKPVVVVIEKVWASPIMGPSQSFAFGANYGGWIAAAKAHGLTVFAVTPQAWQRVICPQIDSSGAERKAELKRFATGLFPEMKVTLTNCDALLLSEYAVRQIAACKRLGEEVI